MMQFYVRSSFGKVLFYKYAGDDRNFHGPKHGVGMVNEMQTVYQCVFQNATVHETPCVQHLFGYSRWRNLCLETGAIQRYWLSGIIFWALRNGQLTLFSMTTLLTKGVKILVGVVQLREPINDILLSKDTKLIGVLGSIKDWCQRHSMLTALSFLPMPSTLFGPLVAALLIATTLPSSIGKLIFKSSP